MGLSGDALRTRQEVLRDWGDELTGLSLNLFADELPATLRDDPSQVTSVGIPVLRRWEKRARIRRGCLASSMLLARDLIAADIYYVDRQVGDWTWAHRLPSAMSNHYDRTSHRRLVALVVGLWDRMEAGRFDGPSCTAEELLLSIILEDYEARLDACELDGGFVDLEDHWFQDQDFMWLYNSELVRTPGALAEFERTENAINLQFDAWFTPFQSSVTVPGPISEAELNRINGS